MMKRYLFVFLLLLLGMTACTALQASPEQAITGKWVNSGEGEINFNRDGTGFVPGVEGKIPAYQFTYNFKDETHLAINIANLPTVEADSLPIVGQGEIVVAIKIEQDKMIWRDSSGDVEFVYQRAK